MIENIRYPEHMVFGLDIGTRSIVGTVGYLDRGRFKVAAQCIKEHDTRAMIDGQIHDIVKVGEIIRQVKDTLELTIGRKLSEVCIAAAGRVLETVTIHIEQEFSEDTLVTNEHVYSLDMLGVERAHEQLSSKEKEIRFFCVGYSIIKYYSNSFEMNHLEGHKARKIGADVLATFLPEEVVDGLYASVKEAGLEVASLTLEPIAAIQVAIPEQFRLLNIGLVDLGAGTSDICITKDGSVSAYGMIPIAGDEITEAIARDLLTEFKTAEKIKLASGKKRIITYKDIMGLSHKISPEDVLKIAEKTVDYMAKDIGDKIIELNGGKAVSAVFLVGGGGRITGFAESLAEYLGLAKDRVAIRGVEVLKNIDYLNQKTKKDSLLVTPIGICLNFYNQKNNFIFVYFNEERIKLYNNDRLTVIDAAMQYGFPNGSLFPKRGQDLVFKVDDKQRIIKGEAGEGAKILLNEQEVSLQSSIGQNDKIIIIESTEGKAAHCTIEELAEYKKSIQFEIMGKMILCPRFAEVNGELKSGYYQIANNDTIYFLNYYTVTQLLQFLDLDLQGEEIYVNNQKADMNDKVFENFSIRFEKVNYSYNDLT